MVGQWHRSDCREGMAATAKPENVGVGTRIRSAAVDLYKVVEGKAKQWADVVADKNKRDVQLDAFRTSSVKKGRTLDRTMQFWMRCMSIYTSYKVCQFRVQFVANKRDRDRIWEEQHEFAAEKVYALCTELGGFFLKSAQVLAKPDLVPEAWVKKLIVLCDDAPATSFCKIQSIVESELGMPLDVLFERFDKKPVGCASIAQVHRARIRGKKNDVAVKVQHPGAEELMMTDIANQKAFGAFLQKFDIHFDLLSAVNELEQQVHLEFDFLREAKSMDRIATTLYNENRGRPPIQVPRPVKGMATRRVLVMDFVEGVPILQLASEMAKRGISLNSSIAKNAKRTILHNLTAAYGQMILRDGFFQADPHPGNILIDRNGKVALLDYGQVKELPEELRLGFAKLVLGLASSNVHKIEQAMEDLGIETTKLSGFDEVSMKQLAMIMFDTKLPDGLTMVNPFEDDSLLKKISVPKFPKDLFFLLRTIHILRGLSIGMGISYSAAEEWKDLAQDALNKKKKSSFSSELMMQGSNASNTTVMLPWRKSTSSTTSVLRKK